MPGVQELAVFCSALIGAGLGFLWFNAPPAAVFMGDTGSLALGGALGAVAVATKHEIVLLIVGGLFVVETVSVIIQVFWFKRTGRRVFLMAPLHHHFEKKGWSEPTIVIRFWIISMILALVGPGDVEDPMIVPLSLRAKRSNRHRVADCVASLTQALVSPHRHGGAWPGHRVFLCRASQDVDGRPSPAMTAGQGQFHSGRGRPTVGGNCNDTGNAIVRIARLRFHAPRLPAEPA